MIDITTRRPRDQMTAQQLKLDLACNRLNGVCSDLHYLAHEAKPDELTEGTHQWGEDWDQRIADAKRYLDEVRKAPNEIASDSQT